MMNVSDWSSRRHFVIGSALLLAGCAGAQSSSSTGKIRIDSISVDTSPIAENGYPEIAAFISQKLTAALLASFPGSSARGTVKGTQLNVRVNRYFLSSEVANSPLDAVSDDMSGVVTVRRGNEVIKTFPQIATSNPVDVGAWYFTNWEQLRLARLTQVFAGWIQRELN